MRGDKEAAMSFDRTSGALMLVRAGSRLAEPKASFGRSSLLRAWPHGPRQASESLFGADP